MRRPVVAGQFYSSTEKGLKDQIERTFQEPPGPGKLPEKGRQPRSIIGAVVPHAGYMFSGYEAAHVYYELSREEKPETTIIIGPNHTGMGSPVALSTETWETPLGKVPVDMKTSNYLLENSKLISDDSIPHSYEHSIEVQLPFLQYIYGDFQFVPITIGVHNTDTIKSLADTIAKIKKDVLIIASSDFTHYETAENAREKDLTAIENIKKLDFEKFLDTVYSKKASICGYGPIATCILASKIMGARHAELLKYGSSGDVTGDYSQVVAYAGMVFRR